MKKYELKTKNAEVIKTTLAENLEEATEYFSIIKGLSTKDINEIFVITEK